MTLSKFYEPVLAFIKKQSRLTLTVITLLILFTISAIVILCISAGSKGKKKPYIPYDETFAAIDEFLPPAQPAIVEDHYYARQKDGKWDSEDEERWFTQIDSDFLGDLSLQNDALTETILGAAP